ncbi:putative RNA methylase [Ferroglobus placidus DSM 10642]|uniref:Putative RNA methylase n=1 Tax=Ferroglobus placidus (strain DSM 10642 / AEDII12DO) TaxID=589924 RepID=D3RYX9_FERPA|nr:tRNA (guanine(6)-N2)-methyltransferase [Ferroglobus placidus]ADC65692.1 putative RNA methylase [Ferroglobus placidus DSM 10642]
MIFYSTTAPGLEDVAAEELKELGCRIKEERKGKGRVFFEAEIEDIPKLNCFSRCSERIVLLLGRFKVEKLEDVYKAVKSIDFSFIKPEQSFAIRANRVGEHGFTSIDIAREAGQAVIDRYKEDFGVRLRVNLDEPDVIIRCDLVDDDFVVGVDTTGDEALHKRNYRIYQHPAPLNPTIASSLVRLSGWSHNYSLLDPMCGSGTILIEAGMIAKNIPVCKFRENYAYKKLFKLPEPEWEEKDVELKLYGMEKFKKHVEGARKIAEYVGIPVTYIQGDARKLDEYFDSIDFIVTNPPYGLRIARKGIIEDLYSKFLESASKVLEKKLVMITAEKNIARHYAEKFFEIKEERNVMYGGLNCSVFVLE